MARRNFQSCDWIKFLDECWPTVGRQLFANSTTCTVALSTIIATDVVIPVVTSYATSAYVTQVAITAGTGFIATVNTDPGANASLSYVVHKVNS